jgi:hypothetical protein
LTRVHKVSSYRGLTVEFTRQRKTSVDDVIGPHLRRACSVYYHWLSSSVLYSLYRTTGRHSISRGTVFGPRSSVFHFCAVHIPLHSRANRIEYKKRL